MERATRERQRKHVASQLSLPRRWQSSAKAGRERPAANSCYRTVGKVPQKQSLCSVAFASRLEGLQLQRQREGVASQFALPCGWQSSADAVTTFLASASRLEGLNYHCIAKRTSSWMWQLQRMVKSSSDISHVCVRAILATLLTGIYRLIYPPYLIICG